MYSSLARDRLWRDKEVIRCGICLADLDVVTTSKTRGNTDGSPRFHESLAGRTIENFMTINPASRDEVDSSFGWL